MYSKIKKINSFKHATLTLLTMSLLLINIAVELKSNVQTDDFLLLRSFLVITVIFFAKNSQIKPNRVFKTFLYFWIALFLTNIALNMINVYELECFINEQVCSVISSVFFKFKIFRFITLSSYFFTIPILLLVSLKHDLKLKLQLKNLDYLQKLFLLLISILIFSNLLRSFQAIYSSMIQSYQVLDENYYDRFTFKKGGVSYYGWIRVYSNFIIANTTDEARFLIPPQSDNYKMEGNVYYFRWFLYPRKLYHLEGLIDKNSSEIDYIVLSAGECDDNQCVWPDYQISKDKIDQILLINRETQVIEVLSETDYNPKDFYQKWGLIKLK